MDASAIPHLPEIMTGINHGLDRAIHLMESPWTIKAITWGVYLLGGGGAFKWLKNRAVEKWAHLAFMAVEELARRDPEENTLDKAALFASRFEGMMKSAGWWMLTEKDVEQAKHIADALNLAYENAKAYAESEDEPAVNGVPVVPAAAPKPEAPDGEQPH